MKKWETRDAHRSRSTSPNKQKDDRRSRSSATPKRALSAAISPASRSRVLPKEDPAKVFKETINKLNLAESVEGNAIDEGMAKSKGSPVEPE